MAAGPPLRIVVLGASAHARVVIEAIRAMGHEVAGVLDRIGAGMPDADVLGAPILGDDDLLGELAGRGLRSVAVAIGDNRLRERVADAAARHGLSFPAIVHPSALVSPSARLDDGCVVMARAVIGAGAWVGELAIVNSGAVVEHDNRIGRAAHVASGCALAGTVTVGARAMLGVGCAVRPDITIGDDATVGAGGAVVADVPAGETVGGVPARPLRRPPVR